MSKYKIMKDSIGEIEVPADKFYGPQTQRSLLNFTIHNEKIPFALISEARPSPCRPCPGSAFPWPRRLSASVWPAGAICPVPEGPGGLDSDPDSSARVSVRARGYIEPHGQTDHS